MSDLRPYQREAVDAVLAALRAGHRSALLVMATGTGKTRTGGAIVVAGASAGRRILWLAPRRDLVAQAAAALPVPTGIEMGRTRSAETDRVVVGSVDSMVRRRHRFQRQRFDLIVVDEAHMAPSSIKTLLEHFESAKVLGLTATPDRLDGRSLSDLFDVVAYRYEIDRAIRDGYLSPIRAERIVVDGLRLDSLNAKRGDFKQSELSAAMREESPLHGVVGPLLDRAGTRPTVAFCADVAHAQALAEVANRYRPGCALAVWGEDPERDAKRARFEAGAVQFVFNCALWSVGVDIPMISCVAMCRPTRSRAKYTQEAGRGTRLCEGKADLLILDFVGATTEHRLIGPADMLAGEVVPDGVRARVAELREEFIDLGELDLLAMARAWFAERQEVEKRQSHVQAVVNYFATEIDPFLGTELAARQVALDFEPATDRQRRLLKGIGCDQIPPTATAASALLEALNERREAGLCSLRAVRKLNKRVPGMTHATAKQASDIWAYLRETGYKRRVPRRLYP